MSLDQRLLAALAESPPRSAQSLASELGATGDRVRRRLRQLQRDGWPIATRRGAGYVLDPDARPLDAQHIESGLAHLGDHVARVVLWPTIASTQRALADAPVLDDGRAVVAIADRQTAGHGRRGRSWDAPPGGAITASLARRLPQPSAALGPLGPGLGLAVAQALRARGVDRAGVKWPNDVLIGRAKVGGVLVDAAGDRRGGARIVVGVGVNYDLGARPDGDGRTDLRSALAQPPSRSEWVVEIVRALIICLSQAARYGPATALAGWDDLDGYRDQRVQVTGADGAMVAEGIAAGVDGMGAVQVDTATGRRRFQSGEVSLRAVESC